MLHGSSPAVALLVTIVAVLVAVAAVLFIVWSAGLRIRLAGRRRPLGHAQVRLSRVATEVRSGLDRGEIAIARSRLRIAAQEQDMRRWTHTLAIQRASIEHVTTGRAARIIRLAHLVTRAAQIAFLWR